MKETKIVAPVENWWPDAAHDLVVHILPQKKVVVQITNMQTRPRRDLLQARLDELGLKATIYETFMTGWVDGPEVRTDGKK